MTVQIQAARQGERPSGAEAAGDAVVSFVNVQKTYDAERLVVRNLNLDIRRGEFLTMLGPSGSGKTTTLMMLAGFEPATHGEILLNGRPINRVPPDRRGIGMVFQNYALFPHMTVAENLAFPLQVRSVPKADIERRVRDALAMVELGGFGTRLPAQLSGGQQQRVAVARALIFEPEVVLMDEPLGALDKQLREQMQYEIKRLHERLGVTIVYVTHDQSEALTMSDRIAVFHEGVVQQLDTPQGLYELPGNSFVAGFIGENNVLAGTLEGIDGESCRVRLGDGTLVRARPVRAEKPGRRVSLSLRPEKVDIDPPGEADNRLPASVQETIYHGDHMRVRLAVSGNDDFTVKMRYRANRRVPSPGERLTIGFSARDCLALDAGA